MPEYRRSLIEGGTYFFTVVTYNRLPILITPEARQLLRVAMLDVRERYPFNIDAVCLLPEHIHCIWTLPEDDAQYSLRWGEIKRLFTKGYLDQIGPGGDRNESRAKRGEAAIWQRRFGEQYPAGRGRSNRHQDYNKYNPVKHRLVQSAGEWPWSSFHRYVKLGYYERGWGEAVRDVVKRMGCGE